MSDSNTFSRAFKTAELIVKHASESSREYTPAEVKLYLKPFDGAEVNSEHLEKYPSWRLITIDSSRLIPKEHWNYSKEAKKHGEEIVSEYAGLPSIEAPPIVASKRGRISALSPAPVEGKLYVIEGHHRTVAAQRNGGRLRAFVPSIDVP